MVESYHKKDYVKSYNLWIENIKYYSTNRVNTYIPPENNLDNAFFQENFAIKTPIDVVVEGIKELGLEKSKIGIEGDKLPFRYLNDMKKTLPAVDFVDASEILNRLRAVKTNQEVRRIKRVYDVADKTYSYTFELLAPGITPYEIFMKQIEFILNNKCTMNFQHNNFGGVNDFAIAVNPDYKIKKGDYGVMDIGVWKNGYQTDFARVISLGKPKDELKKVYDVVANTRREIIKKLEPGVKGKDLFKVGSKYLEKKGYITAINCLGHGLGITMHEKPFINSGEEYKIKIGNVIVIEIYIEVKDIGPFLLEDAGLVTEDGWKSFSKLGDELIII
jgi:Xaa-Pro aminopeptidase